MNGIIQRVSTDTGQTVMGDTTSFILKAGVTQCENRQIKS